MARRTPPVKEFIDWTLSDAGQKILQDIGYVPAPEGHEVARWRCGTH